MVIYPAVKGGASGRRGSGGDAGAPGRRPRTRRGGQAAGRPRCRHWPGVTTVRIAVTALLMLYAAAVPTAGSRLLSRAAWPQQVPRAGISAGLAAAVSAVVSAAMAGVVADVPCAPVLTDPAILEACLFLLRAQDGTPGVAS